MNALSDVTRFFLQHYFLQASILAVSVFPKLTYLIRLYTLKDVDVVQDRQRGSHGSALAWHCLLPSAVVIFKVHRQSHLFCCLQALTHQRGKIQLRKTA
jgi:hypothetical protein